MLRKLKNVKAETWIWWVCCLLICVLLFSLCLSVISFTRVRGSSMNPTVSDGDCYIATTYWSIDPGDIVIAQSDALNTRIIKRVIGVPGDTIGIYNGIVYRNGQPLTEDYIAEPMVTADLASFTLGEDMYFLMGDNRNVSADSRRIGPVAGKDILFVVNLQIQPYMFFIWLASAIAVALATVALADLITGCIMRLCRKCNRRTATA